MKTKGLSGMTVSKNCLTLDYCIEECIRSMLPICDEVVVGDMGSDDGTREWLDRWCETEPKLRVVRIRDWTKERGSKTWFTSALNDTRQHLKFSMMLQLDSDEVLCDDNETFHSIAHACLNTHAFAFDRINFVRDAHSVIPENECCGRWVTRIGPSHLWLPSDEPHSRGEIHLLDMSFVQPLAKIHHLGFLRRREAFFAKAKVVLGAFFNEYDTRLAKAEESGSHPFAEFPWWNRLTRYDGYYPDAVKKWMEARNYAV